MGMLPRPDQPVSLATVPLGSGTAVAEFYGQYSWAGIYVKMALQGLNIWSWHSYKRILGRS